MNERPERPERTSGLGRGLGALIPQRGGGHASAIEIPISRISPNPYQPRKRFDPEDLASLRASIEAHGVIQPILVSETATGYQLVKYRSLFTAADLAPFAGGFAVSFAAALIAVKALIRYVAHHDFRAFAWYRIALGILVLAYFL